MPCTNREASSRTISLAKPKTRLAPAKAARPTIAVGFAPNRATAAPEGNAPKKTPAGKAATRMPASVFESPSSSV